MHACNCARRSCNVTRSKSKDPHMSANVSKATDGPRRDSAVAGRLFFLDVASGRIMSVNPDGSNLKVILEEGRKLPDGLAIDAAAGHLYWTNMGNLKANDGSIMRSDLDGKHVTTIIPPGGTLRVSHTQRFRPSCQPKQRIRSAGSVLRALQPHPSALYRVRSASALS